MRVANQAVSHCLFAVVTFASLSALVRAQERTEIAINDTGVQAENLTSSQDGSVYFGSTAKGTIYRAAPGASQSRTAAPARSCRSRRQWR
jgi:streptogramin lyase